MKRFMVLAAVVAIGVACGPKKGNNGGKGSQTKRQGSASKTVKKSSAGVTQNPEALKVFKQGVKVIQQGRQKGKPTHAEAIKLFKKATSLDGNFAEAWYNLGVVYEDLAKLDEARKAYTKSANAKRDFTEAYVALGRIYIHQKKTDKAKQLYSNLLSKDPKNEGYRNQMVNILRLEKNYGAAERQVREILFKSDKNVEAYKNLSLVYMDQGKYDLAKLVCANALKIKKDDPGIFHNLGLISLKQKDIPGATAQFKAALAIDPNYMPALLDSAALALDHKDYTTAASHLNRVLVQKPFDVPALTAMAVTKRGRGDNDGAKKIYGDLIKADPSNPEPYYNLGVLYHFGYDKPKKALEYYAQYTTKATVDTKHPVHQMSRIANATLAKRSKEAAEIKRQEEEMKRMEAEMKRQEEAAAAKLKAEEDKKKREEEAKKKKELEKKEKMAKDGDKAKKPAPKKTTNGGGKPKAN